VEAWYFEYHCWYKMVLLVETSSFRCACHNSGILAQLW
jgi:hypothetical protein